MAPDWQSSGEDGFALLIEDFLAAQADKAAEAIRASYQAARKLTDDQRDRIEAILAAYSWEDWDALVPKIQAILGEAGAEAAQEALGQIAALDAETGAARINPVVGVTFGEIHPETVEYARDRAAEMVGRKYVGGELVDNPDAKWAITDSTRDWLREEIAQAMENKLSPSELVASIRESQAFSKSRAKMIAHTESANAALHSVEASALDNGATHKRTSLSADHDHDDVCDAAAEAGKVPVDYEYPGGFKRPLFHPRCQCSISYYVERKKRDGVQ